MSLELIKSPIYDDGTTVTAAVFTLNQVFFKVQRNDYAGLPYIVSNNLGKAQFDFDAGSIILNVGDYFYIAQDELNPNTYTSYKGLHQVVGNPAPAVYDTNTNFVDTNAAGIVTFSTFDVFTLIATVQADNEAYNDNTIQYKIPFNLPVYSLDLKGDLENLFVLDNNTYSEARITLSAIDGEGNPVTGSAIATYDVQLFESFVPKGYQYGASMIGFVPRTTILGLFLTRFRTPKLYTGINTLFPFRFYFAVDVDSSNWNLRFQELDVNKQEILSSDAALPQFPLGIQDIGINPQVLNQNTKYVTFQLTLDDVAKTPLTNVKTYSVECIQDNEIILRWKNALGGYDFWAFKIFNDASFENTKGLEYEKGGVYDDKDNEDTIVNLQGSTIQKYLLTTDGIEDINLPAINEIMTSTDIEILTYNSDNQAYASVPVTVDNIVSFPYQYGQKRNHSISINVSLPKNSAFLPYLLTQYNA